MDNRRAKARIAAALLPFMLLGCGSAGRTPSSKVPTSESGLGVAISDSASETQWRAQAKTWLKDHSGDLSRISDSAQVFGVALKAGDVKATSTAINDFLVKIVRTEADLPPNEFGHDLNEVLTSYVGAISMIRDGLLSNNAKLLSAGSGALSVAVAKFGVITARLKATP